MRILTGVSAVLCAAHSSREGVLHGHTWQVTAWWYDEPDAVEKQRELNHYLKMYDHSVLPDGLARGECLARVVLHAMGCCKVEVSRPLEGIHALVEWYR